MSSKQLSVHDLELLRIAVVCVTQFSSSFAKDIWQVSSVATTRRLKKLQQRGLLRSRNVLASTPPPIKEPLCFWKPGLATPHCGQVSYQARKRWKSCPVEIQRVYHATDLGRGLLGRSPVKQPRDIQATHDIGLAEMFLRYHKRYPRLVARCWLNESEYAHLRGRCVKVEDAVLRRGNITLLMLDYAGAYRPDRVEALMQHAQLHNAPIVIY